MAMVSGVSIVEHRCSGCEECETGAFADLTLPES